MLFNQQNLESSISKSHQKIKEDSSCIYKAPGNSDSSIIITHITTHHRLVLTKNGLGISSLSGSHTGTGATSCLTLPASTLTGLPPALACANSTNVRPVPTFKLRVVTALTISSAPAPSLL